MATNPNPTPPGSYLPDMSIGRDRGQFAYRSDIEPAAQHRLSDSIAEPTGSALSKVKQLQSYYFYFNELGHGWGFDDPSIDYPEWLDENLTNGMPKRIGLIAQELMAVEPTLVRPMTWLGEDAAGEGQGDFYWVDYNALYVLCIDAINELNARAEAAKVALGITPAETYPTKPVTTTTSTPPTNWNLSVTPTIGIEGSQSVWTLTADNVPDNTWVGFILKGTCNHKDITCSNPDNRLRTYNEQEVYGTISDPGGENDGRVIWPDYDPETMGWAQGIFIFNNGQAQITLDYAIDNQVEGEETIIMELKSPSSSKHNVAPISATAIVKDA